MPGRDYDRYDGRDSYRGRGEYPQQHNTNPGAYHRRDRDHERHNSRGQNPGRGRGGGRGGGGRDNDPIRFHDERPDRQTQDDVHKVEKGTESNAGAQSATSRPADKGKDRDSGTNQPTVDTVEDNLPLRPGYGTRGNDVELWANYVALNLSKDVVFYRYSLDIEKELDNNRGQPAKADPKSAPGNLPGGTAKRKPAGMKQAEIIAYLLGDAEELRAGCKNGTLATDYRDILVSTQPLVELEHRIMYFGVRSNYIMEPCKIILKEPEDIPNPLRMSDLLQYLGSTNRSETPPIPKSVFSQILNIWLRHFSKSYELGDNSQAVVSSKGYALDGRTKLPRNHRNHVARASIGLGIDAIRGYFSSVRLGAGKAWINVNVTHGTFFQSLRLDKWVVASGLNHPSQFARLHEVLKGVRVRLRHRKAEVNQTKKDLIKVISGLATAQDGVPEKDQQRRPEYPPKFGGNAPKIGATCSQVQFYDKDRDRYVTIYDYFYKAYPDFPVGRDELVVNLGGRLHPAYYPLSVCHIVEGQNYKPKLSGSQTADMITVAQLRPDRSVECITQDGFEVIGIRPPTSNSSLLFPAQPQAQVLNAASTLALASGRILGPPSVSYDNTSVGNQPGKWNLRDVRKYTRCGRAARWAVLPIENTGTHPAWNQTLVPRLDGLMRTRGFAQQGQGRMHSPVLSNDVHRAGLRARFAGFRNQGYNLLFVLLPRDGPELYNLIKAVGDVDVGIHTVCMLESKILKKPQFDQQHWDNILLKANLKCGGVNHKLKFDTSDILSRWRTMVVGLDVTHAAPGARDTTHSIAGMVANVDSQLAQWPATICFQPHESMEIVDEIDCFEQLLGPHLKRYAKVNSRFPEVLVVYRDGVSEGQYDQVVAKEYPRIREVCDRLYTAARQQPPLISIIIVGKRHHTRFYPRKKSGADNKGNPLPGTIVDRSITSQFLWEFYLQAHEAIQGTARPAHYVVVVDEFFGPTFKDPRNMPRANPPYKNAADVLEGFTHALSYALGRSTRSTGVCTPARLADTVCDRARCYTSAGVPQKDVRIADALKDDMFYI